MLSSSKKFSLEKYGSSIHLKESLLTKTLTRCDTTLMEIAKRYLNKAMEYVSFINASELLSAPIVDEPVTKKIKTVESRLNRKERCYKYTVTYKQHIHAVMSLLDILEIGKKDQPLAMDKCIKWAELIVKYFFWSLTETGNLLTDLINFQKNEQNFIANEYFCLGIFRSK